MLGNCPISPPLGWGSQKPPPGVSIDRGHPLTRELLAYWPCRCGAGTRLLDESGRRYHGNIVGAAWKPTSAGIGLYFADNQRVECGNVPGPDLGSYTLAARVRISEQQPDSSSGIRLAGLAGRGFLAATTGAGLWFRNEAPAFQARYGGTVAQAIASTAIADGLWHTLVGVLRRGVSPVCELWMDGELLASASASSLTGLNLSPNALIPFSIGSRYDTSAWHYDLLGYADNVAVWSRALLADEIRQFHRQPFCMFELGTPVMVGQTVRPLIDGALASDTPLVGAVA